MHRNFGSIRTIGIHASTSACTTISNFTLTEFSLRISFALKKGFTIRETQTGHISKSPTCSATRTASFEACRWLSASKFVTGSKAIAVVSNSNCRYHSYWRCRLETRCYCAAEFLHFRISFTENKSRSFDMPLISKKKANSLSYVAATFSAMPSCESKECLLGSQNPGLCFYGFVVYCAMCSGEKILRIKIEVELLVLSYHRLTSTKWEKIFGLQTHNP